MPFDFKTIGNKVGRPAMSKERSKEVARRSSRAVYLATTALKYNNDEEYHDLLGEARAFVNKESGPLPD